MTDSYDQHDQNERAVLLPEERAAGSVDSQAQAEAILAESEERMENEAVGIRDDNVADGAGIGATETPEGD